ncbi:MAG: hypothetical protein AAF481_10245 [Acidobacteriota bacterium]
MSGSTHEPSRSRPPWLLLAAVFLVAWGALGVFYSQHPVLYDADSYYHLAIARMYAEHGPFVDELPQARFSEFRDGFGDKEFLFHAALVPFVQGGDLMAGGRWALALFNALIFTALFAFGYRALGPWGLVVPWWLVVGSLEFSWRMVRLRPELLSLLILLLAIAAAAGRRYRWLGVLGAVYALSYTAFQVFLGIFGLLFLWTGWSRRRWEWPLLLYAGLGVAVGLVVHPQFPHNLDIWVLQNVLYFQDTSFIRVGSELQPAGVDAALFANLGWFLGALILWWASRPGTAAGGVAGRDGEETTRLAYTFAIAAIAFGGLYVLMSRFSIYFFVFAGLWVLFDLRRRGRVFGHWIALPGRGRLPTLVAVGLALLVCLPGVGRELRRFDLRTSAGPDEVRLRDREAVGAALPAGARVLAPHASTGIYMLWAPEALFLNPLDPVPIYRFDPAAFQAYREILDGSEPDVPLRAATVLASDYIVYSVVESDFEAFDQRMTGDPRLTSLHRLFNGVYRIEPQANGGFVLDWDAVSAGLFEPEREAAVAVPYPRADSPQAAAVEGFVNAARVVGDGECATFEQTTVFDVPVTIDFEFAPYGPASLWVDGERLVSAQGSLRAVLGQGLRVTVPFAAGSRRIVVETCPEGGQNGFYLLVRGLRESAISPS